jgi:hypothetical protein
MSFAVTFCGSEAPVNHQFTDAAAWRAHNAYLGRRGYP